MAAAAEQLEIAQFDKPEATLISAIPEDRFSHQKALWLIKSVGSIAASSEVYDGCIRTASSKNLMDSLRLADSGDIDAEMSVDRNVITDFIERCIKAGIVMEVELQEGPDGEILQNGQTLDSIQANSVRYVGKHRNMKERIKIEARNSFRLEQEKNNGSLEDNYFVVFSLTDDEMTNKQLDDEGFFVDEMSCAIQATTMTADGLVLQSAFVAGVNEPGTSRHDKHGIVAVGREIGIDFKDKTTTEILDMAVLIPKSLMPNGVIDLVKLYDKTLGTFFGQNKPQQDYLEYTQFCKRRQAEFLPIAQKIRKQLIAEYSTFKTPTDATKRLGKLTEKYGVKNAVKDPTINPHVFGSVAAKHIEEARGLIASGNHEQAKVALQRAERTAKSSSCPGSILDEQDKKNADGTEKETNEERNDEVETKSGKIRCIKCRETVNKKDVVKEQSWRCPHCKYEVDICDGKVLHESQPPKRKETKAGSWMTGILKAA